MSGTSITINWRTSKKGDKYFYLKIGGLPKYPISHFDVEEDGTLLIFFPCLYILKDEFMEGMSCRTEKNIEGWRAFVEAGSDYGRVELVEDKEIWSKIYGDRRFLSGSAHERIDGEMVLVWNKEKSEAHLAYCVKE